MTLRCVAVAGLEPPDRSSQLAPRAGRLRLDAATADLLRRFELAGVEVLLLKGRSIASWLYAERELRTYSDCDVLIAPSAVEAAEAVLASLGFTPLFDDRGMPAWWREHATTWSDGERLTVDLHRTLPGVGVNAATTWGALCADAMWLPWPDIPPPPSRCPPGRCTSRCTLRNTVSVGPGPSRTWNAPWPRARMSCGGVRLHSPSHSRLRTRSPRDSASRPPEGSSPPGWDCRRCDRSTWSCAPRLRRPSRSAWSSSPARTARERGRTSCGVNSCHRPASSVTGILAPATAARACSGPTCGGRCGSSDARHAGCTSGVARAARFARGAGRINPEGREAANRSMVPPRAGSTRFRPSG